MEAATGGQRALLRQVGPRAALPTGCAPSGAGLAGGGASPPLPVLSRCLPAGAGLADSVGPRPLTLSPLRLWGGEPMSPHAELPQALGWRVAVPPLVTVQAGGSRSPHAVSPQVLGWRVAAAVTWSVLLLPICTAAFIVLSGLDPFHPVRWISSMCPAAFSCFCSHVFVFLGLFFSTLRWLSPR